MNIHSILEIWMVITAKRSCRLHKKLLCSAHLVDSLVTGRMSRCEVLRANRLADGNVVDEIQLLVSSCEAQNKATLAANEQTPNSIGSWLSHCSRLDKFAVLRG